jgi:hypothetical protein
VNAGITGTLADGTTSVGTPGQVLSSTGTGTAWVSQGSGSITKISEVVLGSDTPTISFSSVPQTYRHLKLFVAGRSSVNSDVYLQFNGDTGANYDGYFFYNGGTGSTYATSQAQFGFVAVGSAPANQAGVFELTIFDYARTTWLKNSVAMCSKKETSGSGFVVQVGATWNSTAAITDIVMGLVGGGNLIAGTIVELYGVS